MEILKPLCDVMEGPQSLENNDYIYFLLKYLILSNRDEYIKEITDKVVKQKLEQMKEEQQSKIVPRCYPFNEQETGNFRKQQADKEATKNLLTNLLDWQQLNELENAIINNITEPFRTKNGVYLENNLQEIEIKLINYLKNILNLEPENFSEAINQINNIKKTYPEYEKTIIELTEILNKQANLNNEINVLSQLIENNEKLFNYFYNQTKNLNNNQTETLNNLPIAKEIYKQIFDMNIEKLGGINIPNPIKNLNYAKELIVQELSNLKNKKQDDLQKLENEKRNLEDIHHELENIKMSPLKYMIYSGEQGKNNIKKALYIVEVITKYQNNELGQELDDFIEKYFNINKIIDEIKHNFDKIIDSKIKESSSKYLPELNQQGFSYQEFLQIVVSNPSRLPQNIQNIILTESLKSFYVQYYRNLIQEHNPKLNPAPADLIALAQKETFKVFPEATEDKSMLTNSLQEILRPVTYQNQKFITNNGQIDYYLLQEFLTEINNLKIYSLQNQISAAITQKHRVDIIQKLIQNASNIIQYKLQQTLKSKKKSIINQLKKMYPNTSKYEVSKGYQYILDYEKLKQDLETKPPLFVNKETIQQVIEQTNMLLLIDKILKKIKADYFTTTKEMQQIFDESFIINLLDNNDPVLWLIDYLKIVNISKITKNEIKLAINYLTQNFQEHLKKMSKKIEPIATLPFSDDILSGFKIDEYDGTPIEQLIRWIIENPNNLRNLYDSLMTHIYLEELNNSEAQSNATWNAAKNLSIGYLMALDPQEYEFFTKCELPKIPDQNQNQQKIENNNGNDQKNYTLQNPHQPNNRSKNC